MVPPARGIAVEEGQIVWSYAEGQPVVDGQVDGGDLVLGQICDGRYGGGIGEHVAPLPPMVVPVVNVPSQEVQDALPGVLSSGCHLQFQPGGVGPHTVDAALGHLVQEV